MLLKLTEPGAKYSVLGYKYITPLKYGFDSSGMLRTVICKVQTEPYHDELRCFSTEAELGELFEGGLGYSICCYEVYP
jgi:hypothetical protein|tara:strand:+ start:66 stop:299 length:234 start_codon:yes stop_codon:yes gene_type:complete